MRIDLKQVNAPDAELIFVSWGCHPQNFARLTARVFTEIGDAERYLSALLSVPAFHIVEPGGMVVGIVKAIVTEHRAQVGYAQSGVDSRAREVWFPTVAPLGCHPGTRATRARRSWPLVRPPLAASREA